LSTKNPTWTGLGSKPGPSGERQPIASAMTQQTFWRANLVLPSSGQKIKEEDIQE
jgi:hypothetical protein